MQPKERALMIGGAGSIVVALGLPLSGFQSRWIGGAIAALGLALWCIAAILMLLNRRSDHGANLLFEATDRARLPSTSRGVVGVFSLRAGHPSGIGSTGRMYDSDIEVPILSRAPANARETIKCELTNLGSLPVAKVRLTFGVRIQAAVRRANMDIAGGAEYLVGDTLRDGPWSITITKLLPGVENRAVFYLCNTEEVFIIIAPPTEATFEFLNDTARRTVSMPKIQQKVVLYPPLGV